MRGYVADVNVFARFLFFVAVAGIFRCVGHGDRAQGGNVDL